MLALVAALAFVASDGLWFHDRFRKSWFFVSIAGLLAAGSTILLLKEGLHFFGSGHTEAAPNSINTLAPATPRPEETMAAPPQAKIDTKDETRGDLASFF